MRCLFYPSVVVLIVIAGLGCAKKGLVRDRYQPAYYEIPDLIKDRSVDHNPRFIVYGDNRPGWRVKERFYRKENWWTPKMLLIPFYQIYWLGNGVLGSINGIRMKPDYGDRQARRVRDAVYEEAKRSNVDFIVNTGDIATDGRYPDHWKTFIEQNKVEVPLVLEYPYLPTVGNHEHANDTTYGMPNYLDVFEYEPFYVIRCPDVDFFFADSDIIIDQGNLIDDDRQDTLFEKWFGGGVDPGEPAWLERELRASEKSFKVVVMHHPPIGFAGHYHNWTDPGNGRDLLSKRQRFLELLARYDVTVVFTGHQHMYEHNVLEGIGDVDLNNDLHFVVTGGAGAPLHPGLSKEDIAELEQTYRSEGLVAASVRQDVVYNYCLVEVTPDHISIDVYAVPDRRESPAVLIDHQIIEKPVMDSSQ
ncbi:MAG: metallophosphoesterase [Candidatus Latescibacterota bacterium]|nr:MAG: metallophosphoesterase [Candidatus Latescibacterota bacterium]